MKEVSYRRSTKDKYRNVIFNYHEDVEDAAPLLKEEGNHNLESTKLSPILPEVKFKFESQHVKSSEQVIPHEKNAKKTIETDQEPPAASSKNTDSAGGNDEEIKTVTLNEQDIVIDLQEVAKPTSKKKKNKKSQKVANNAEKKEVATAGEGSEVLEEENSAVGDSTVVSFLEDSHLSQDWL